MINVFKNKATKVCTGSINSPELIKAINEGKIDENIVANIINEDNPIIRRRMVDKLFAILPRIASGYMPVAYTNNLGNASNAVKIDDVEIFYSFFDHLHANKKAGKDLSKNILDSAESTLNEYFCPVNSDTAKGESKRIAISNVVDENGNNAYNEPEKYFTGDEKELKSIRGFKGQNVAMCSERASVAFDLFLALGLSSKLDIETFLIGTNIANIDKNTNAGHAYVIFSISGISQKDGTPVKNYYLFDNAQCIYTKLDNDNLKYDNSKYDNVIDAIKDGEPVVVSVNGRKTKVYSNASLANIEKARNLMHPTQQLSQQSSHQ